MKCFLVVTLLLVVVVVGCDASREPDAVYMETGTGPGQVVYPRALTYKASDGTFFIVDRTAHVQHLDRHMKPLAEWYMPQSQRGKPVGLSVGPDGNLYVPDTHYHRVIVYSPAGGEIRRWGSEGTKPGQFIYPTDIAFDAKGRVYVSEYGDNDRIQVFDNKGVFLFSFGSFGSADGQFSRPQAMLIQGNTIYITDACNHRIVVFDTNGKWLRNMGGVGSELGQFRFPYGLDVDSRGRLVVCEFGNNRVQWIDPRDGKGLKSWGVGGRAPGQLAYPWAISVDKNDRVYVLDAGNNRVQVITY